MATPPTWSLSIDERRAVGRDLRKVTPRSSHADWTPAADRRDPIALLLEQNASRQQDLVPVRHGRMSVSPFTFYRGAARVMAADLASTPDSGLRAQICGDAHLSNFGVFTTPERAQVFDVNDFDETLPGPWEWDLKRLVASFAIAGRNNGFDDATRQIIDRRVTQAYREAMADFAQTSTLETWYARLTSEQILAITSKKGTRMRVARSLDKARTRDNLQALGKLTETVDGQIKIVSAPPIVVGIESLAEAEGLSHEEVERIARTSFQAYRNNIPADRRLLLDRFHMVDLARKVVGVGSVGTFCLIALFLGSDSDDPLFLQIKEANASVLEEFLPKSRYRNHGQRVVEGQRLIQAASDIFLGWSRGTGEAKRHFYWRQLRDGKGSPDVEGMDPAIMTGYARLCGWTLARAHARSGDALAISSYVGTGDVLDRSLAEFSERYADQNQRDYDAFQQAIRDGRVEAVHGV
jgi:uncharacterized protein (DUF2252 family)